jgi:hypothetical protein
VLWVRQGSFALLLLQLTDFCVLVLGLVDIFRAKLVDL